MLGWELGKCHKDKTDISTWALRMGHSCREGSLVKMYDRSGHRGSNSSARTRSHAGKTWRWCTFFEPPWYLVFATLPPELATVSRTCLALPIELSTVFRACCLLWSLLPPLELDASSTDCRSLHNWRLLPDLLTTACKASHRLQGLLPLPDCAIAFRPCHCLQTLRYLQTLRLPLDLAYDYIQGPPNSF